MYPHARPFNPALMSLTADAGAAGDYAMEPVPSVESVELLIHDGYSDSPVSNGTGQPGDEPITQVPRS